MMRFFSWMNRNTSSGIDVSVEIEESDAAETRSMKPHRVPNMPSRIGRLIEKATYLDIFIVAALILLSSSLYFTLAPTDHAISAQSGFLTSLYFSVVTFTTVGYGDITPVGFGKVIAMLLASSGLILTALFVGKVASERQSSLLLLLHTSDTQRRISGFSNDLGTYRDNIALAFRESPENLTEHLKLLRKLIVAVTKYLAFNSFQARIFDFGNFTSLSMLYEELDSTFSLCFTVFRDSPPSDDPTRVQAAYVNCKLIFDLIHLMNNFHAFSTQDGSIVELYINKYVIRKQSKLAVARSATKKRAEQLEKTLSPKIKDGQLWRETGYNAFQIKRVFDKFPQGPRSTWPTGIHKTIATELGITNSVTSRCITFLINSRKLPK